MPSPFFAYIAPHAPHGMAIPEPKYAGHFSGKTAPRTPSWNYSAPDHHWLVAQQPPTRPAEVVKTDAHYAKRWDCLLSVDDLVGAVVAELTAMGQMDNTYIFMTADHGFHFHELRLGMGKWNV